MTTTQAPTRTTRAPLRDILAAETTAHPTLKAEHSAIWALSDEGAISERVSKSLGLRVVAAAGLRPGERTIDIGSGHGNVAVPAAKLLAVVVATDLCPELLIAGRTAAGAVDIAWESADCEDLRYETAGFDVGLSSLGLMYAPFQERAASELLRVVRPGGRIGLIAWTPTSFFGQVLGMLQAFEAPLPEGAGSPTMWGDEAHVRALLGDRVRPAFVRDELSVDCFDSGAAFLEVYKRAYGPLVAIYRALGEDAARVAQLDEMLTSLADDHIVDGTMRWEYLIVTGTVQ